MERGRCARTTSGRTARRRPDRTAAGRPATEWTRCGAPDAVVRTDDARHPLHRVEPAARCAPTATPGSPTHGGRPSNPPGGTLHGGPTRTCATTASSEPSPPNAKPSTPAQAPGARPGRARPEGRRHLALTLPQLTRPDVRCRRPCRRLAAASALGTGTPRTALSAPAPQHRRRPAAAGTGSVWAWADPATARSPDGLPRGAADGRVTGAVTTRRAPDGARGRRDAGAARSRRPHTTAGPIRPAPGTGTRAGAPGSTPPCAAR